MRYPTREYQSDSSSLLLSRSDDPVSTARAPGWPDRPGARFSRERAKSTEDSGSLTTVFPYQSVFDFAVVDVGRVPSDPAAEAGRRVSWLSQRKTESPGCTRGADPLKAYRLVQHTRGIRWVNTQAQRRVSVRSRDVDERVQQGTAYSVSSMIRRNSETDFRSLGVDKPVGAQRSRP